MWAGRSSAIAPDGAPPRNLIITLNLDGICAHLLLDGSYQVWVPGALSRRASTPKHWDGLNQAGRHYGILAGARTWI